MLKEAPAAATLEDEAASTETKEGGTEETVQIHENGNYVLFCVDISIGLTEYKYRLLKSKKHHFSDLAWPGVTSSPCLWK